MGAGGGLAPRRDSLRLGWLVFGEGRSVGSRSQCLFPSCLPGEERGAGMSWLPTLLLLLVQAGCWQAQAAARGHPAVSARGAGILAGAVLAARRPGGLRMGCSLTSCSAPLCGAAFPFRRRRPVPGMSRQRLSPAGGVSVSGAGWDAPGCALVPRAAARPGWAGGVPPSWGARSAPWGTLGGVPHPPGLAETPGVLGARDTPVVGAFLGYRTPA